jgi:hypothetical protein
MMTCPTCCRRLHRVTNTGSWMTSEQFDAVKAGDWYCDACPDNGRGKSGKCYWWDTEVEMHNLRQCDDVMHT